MSIIRNGTWSNCYQFESDKIMTLCIWNVTARIIESLYCPGCEFDVQGAKVQLEQSIHWILETMQSLIQWVPGSISQGVEHPGHETNHCCTSTYPNTFMACEGICMLTCIEHAGHQDIKCGQKYVVLERYLPSSIMNWELLGCNVYCPPPHRSVSIAIQNLE